MLKEILQFVLTALPNWLALVFLGVDRYEKRKDKRADGADPKNKGQWQLTLKYRAARAPRRLT